jgi:hypothetical protein
MTPRDYPVVLQEQSPFLNFYLIDSETRNIFYWPYIVHNSDSVELVSRVFIIFTAMQMINTGKSNSS